MLQNSVFRGQCEWDVQDGYNAGNFVAVFVAMGVRLSVVVTGFCLWVVATEFRLWVVVTVVVTATGLSLQNIFDVLIEKAPRKHAIICQCCITVN